MYKCDNCLRTWKYESEYIRHKNSKRPCRVGQVNYVCDICNYTTKDKTKFDNHKARKYPCKSKTESTRVTDILTEQIKNLGKKVDHLYKEKQKITTNEQKTNANEQKTTEQKNNCGFVYIVQEREFLGTNIYKIGKTNRTMKARMGNYPKNTSVHYLSSVVDCAVVEKQIIDVFDEKFTKMKCYGNEYYDGNLAQMIREVNKITDELPNDEEIGDINEINEITTELLDNEDTE